MCGRDARAPGKPSSCGRDARAPGKPSFHDIVTPRAQKCRRILAPLGVEAGPSVRRQPPCRREPHRPGRRRAMAPFPVDPSGGDGRGCARLGAGGTPALPGSHHCAGGTPALPGRELVHAQEQKIADAFGYRLSFKQVHLSSGLFVSIGGSSSLTVGRFPSNDPHGTAGAALPGSAGVPPACCPIGRR